MSKITGVIGIEGIYDVDLLLESFPSEFYRGFIEQAFGTRSTADSEGAENRRPYNDVNAAKYHLPQSGSAHKLRWGLVHSPEDDLVDIVQAESMYAHLCSLYEEKEDSEATSAGPRVIIEGRRVRGGHDELLESGELAEFVREAAVAQP